MMEGISRNGPVFVVLPEREVSGMVFKTSVVQARHVRLDVSCACGVTLWQMSTTCELSWSDQPKPIVRDADS